MRAVALASLLAVAAVLIVIGVAGISAAGAWIVGGFLLAGWAVLMLAEVSG